MKTHVHVHVHVWVYVHVQYVYNVCKEYLQRCPLDSVPLLPVSGCSAVGGRGRGGGKGRGEGEEGTQIPTDLHTIILSRNRVRQVHRYSHVTITCSLTSGAGVSRP